MLIPRKTRVVDGVTEVAVLVSCGFGAGWSTWNREVEETLLFHEDLADYVLEHAKDGLTEESIKIILETILGEDEDVYVGGVDGLHIRWIEQGLAFVVSEYDGSEGLSLRRDFNWMEA
jgi:hypothetical protein